VYEWKNYTQAYVELALENIFFLRLQINIKHKNAEHADVNTLILHVKFLIAHKK
jgi:hypothetical protein